MMKFLVVGLLCISLNATAQFSISAGTGIGTYNQSELKEFQQAFLNRYNVKGGVNANFPAYVNYEGSFSFSYSRLFFSEIFFNYGSTGGRVSYSDYSGTVSMTQKVNYFTVTSSFGVRWRTEKFQFDAQMRMGRQLSNLTLEQVENVKDNQWRHAGKYTSEGGVFEPNLKVTRINGHLGFFVSAGLSGSFGSSPFDNEDVGGYINTPQGEYLITPDWSGLRIVAGLSLIFGGKRENN